MSEPDDWMLCMTLMLRAADETPEGAEALLRYVQSRVGTTTVAYTLMPASAGAYAWMKPKGDRSPNIGVCCGDASHWPRNTWQGDHRISPDLDAALAQWQRLFKPTLAGSTPSIGWEAFHSKGVSLAARLKRELGSEAVVMYLKPPEDQSREPHEHGFEVVAPDPL